LGKNGVESVVCFHWISNSKNYDAPLFFAIFGVHSKEDIVMRVWLSLVLLIFVADTLDAQITRRLRNQTLRNLEKRVEQKMLDAAAEELAKKAFRPIERAIDEMLKESFKDSLGHDEEVDWEKMGEAYAGFLQGLNQAADLPESYRFDLTMHIDMQDYDGQNNNMIIHFSESEALFGFQSPDENEQEQLIVVDLEKDLIVIYSTDKKGNKSAQAIPSMMGLLAAVSNSTEVDEQDYKVERTNTTRNILGYTTRLYNSSTKDEEIQSYIAEEFPVSWQKSFGSYLERFAPNAFAEQAAAYDGMVLQSTSTQKSDPKKKSTWEATKIDKDTINIVNAEYTLKPLIPEEAD
jgi:hypothetical protein